MRKFRFILLLTVLISTICFISYNYILMINADKDIDDFFNSSSILKVELGSYGYIKGDKAKSLQIMISDRKIIESLRIATRTKRQSRLYVWYCECEGWPVLTNDKGVTISYHHGKSVSLDGLRSFYHVMDPEVLDSVLKSIGIPNDDEMGKIRLEN